MGSWEIRGRREREEKVYREKMGEEGDRKSSNGKTMDFDSKPVSGKQWARLVTVIQPTIEEGWRWEFMHREDSRAS